MLGRASCIQCQLARLSSWKFELKSTPEMVHIWLRSRPLFGNNGYFLTVTPLQVISLDLRCLNLVWCLFHVDGNSPYLGLFQQIIWLTSYFHPYTSLIIWARMLTFCQDDSDFNLTSRERLCRIQFSFSPISRTCGNPFERKKSDFYLTCTNVEFTHNSYIPYLIWRHPCHCHGHSRSFGWQWHIIRPGKTNITNIRTYQHINFYIFSHNPRAQLTGLDTKFFFSCPAGHVVYQIHVPWSNFYVPWIFLAKLQTVK